MLIRNCKQLVHGVLVNQREQGLGGAEFAKSLLEGFPGNSRARVFNAFIRAPLIGAGGHVLSPEECTA
jgi:hypothetical protein